MKKPSPLSRLAALSEEQADQLYELLRAAPYFSAVRHCAKEWGIATSVSGLRRWWKRESERRMKTDLRTAIAASKKFDSDLDGRALDARATNALRAAFWGALANRDTDSIATLGKLVLDYNAGALKASELELKERRIDQQAETTRLAREKFEATEARLNAAADTLKRLEQAGGLTAEGRAEIERAMGLI